ncbi:hypothetical protein TTRE_0000548901 [Trichuris trichiura]|uniref:Abnormal cell migration protein 18-like fibronectin type I domain-containing protein n=1 Tax=Trichuris trichiura TaxID=36087 RepID=A0A077ZCF6_TRITR|nr:hypothetical protein TTRE_0000548901 [Trichuris trichiura]
MYVYSAFLILLLRGAEANRKSSVPLRKVIFEEKADHREKCHDVTSLEQVLGCPFFNKTYSYNDKVVHNHIEYLCTFSKEACKVTMVPIFCLLGETRIEPGVGFVMGKLYYMCSVYESNMGIKAIGCGSENGMRIQIGQKYRVDTLVFYCQLREGKMEAIFIGCDNGSGIVKPGESYNDGQKIAVCQEGKKSSFNSTQQNYPGNQGGKGSHTVHSTSTVRNPTNGMPSAGGAQLKPTVISLERNWFCMDSSILTACQFTVSGKQYTLNLGYGQWIGENLFFCHTNLGGATLCINF